jgi:hypothetical protein
MPSSIPLLLTPLRGLELNKIRGFLSSVGTVNSKPQTSSFSTYNMLCIKALVYTVTLRLSEASWLSKTAVSWNMTP